MHKLAVIALLPVLAGCQTIVTTPPANCSDYIPSAWRLPIVGAQLPESDTVQDWQKFGLAQSGQLSKSNGRTSDVLHIIKTCETKANDARPRKKFLGIF